MPKKYIFGMVGTLAVCLLLAVSLPKEYTGLSVLDQINKSKENKVVGISHYPLYESHPDDAFAQFLNFIAEHGKDKEYQTHGEFNKRFAIFRKNYDRIVKYNRMDDAGFTLEINQFADLEDDEFVQKHSSGIVISEERRKRVEEKTVEPDHEEEELNEDGESPVV